MAMNRRRLFFFVTEDWYFCSHRLQLAVAAQAAGYDVTVVTRVRAHGDVIREAGLGLIPFENARSSLNPLTAILTLARLVRLYRRERPDIVHHVALKPILYGTIAARIAGTSHVINALAGMGWLFSSSKGLAPWLRPVVQFWLSRSLSSGIALVQHSEDAELLVQSGVPSSNIRVIRGSGVDLQHFCPHTEIGGPPVVVLPARLLWDKGVGEFVEAARLLRERGVVARYVLAGEPDELNPAAIPSDQVAAWASDGVIEHLGWVDDMQGLLRKCHVVCLPSYREGLPKSLLEAVAAGLPVVTTDVPGCRDVVRDGENGLLVRARDAVALADALQQLIESAELRRQMGVRGRIRAEEEFGLTKVIQQTLAVYAEGAGERSPPRGDAGRTAGTQRTFSARPTSAGAFRDG